MVFCCIISAHSNPIDNLTQNSSNCASVTMQILQEERGKGKIHLFLFIEVGFDMEHISFALWRFVQDIFSMTLISDPV